MANDIRNNNFKRRIAVSRKQLKLCTSRLQRTASSIGFIEKCLERGCIPKFAKVSGQFVDDRERMRTEFNLLRSHLKQHRENLKRHILDQRNEKEKLISTLGRVLFNLLWRGILNELRNENIKQFKTKNGKLAKLIIHKPRIDNSFSVPIVNLSSFNDLDVNELRFGLDHCYVNKHKFIKRDLAVELECLAAAVDGKVPAEKKEPFHEFLRSFSNRFANNVYQTKDETFKKLHALRSRGTLSFYLGIRILVL